MILHKSQQDIAEALNAADIPHIWLKGIVLAETLYPDPAHRPMVDLDLLVQPDTLQAALDCLQNVGYHNDTPKPCLIPQSLPFSGRSHHHVLRGGPAQSVVIELHYNMLNPRSRDFLSPEQEQWFHQQTTSYAYGDDRFTSLSDEAHFLYLCAHMMLQHGLEDFALTRSLDLHLMITTRSLNWQTIVEKAVELRWTYVVEQALQQTYSTCFSPLFRPSVLDELHLHRPSEEEIRRVEALGQPGAVVER